MRNYLKKLWPFIVLFLLVEGLIVIFATRLTNFHIDTRVLTGANLLLFIVAIITLALHMMALKSSNPATFTNSVMGGTVIKLFIIGAGILTYISLAGKTRSNAAIIASMGLYVLYTLLEVTTALQLNKKKDGRN